jgi:hypothetical protein
LGSFLSNKLFGETVEMNQFSRHGLPHNFSLHQQKGVVTPADPKGK